MGIGNGWMDFEDFEDIPMLHLCGLGLVWFGLVVGGWWLWRWG